MRDVACYGEQPLDTESGQILTPAPLWRRTLAGSFDLLLLVLLGNVLGAFYRNELIAMGPGARLIGLLMFCAYIGGQNSLLGKGQTFGKRLLRIRVVGRDGESLPLERGMLRAFLLVLPVLVSGISISEESLVVSLVMTGLLSVINVGIAAAILYLYLCNRRSGQSLHDLLAGAYVVRAGRVGLPPAAPLWRAHLVAVGTLILLPLAIGPSMWWFWSGGFDWQRIYHLQQTLRASVGTERVDVMHGQFHFLKRDGLPANTRYLQIGAWYSRRIDSFEEIADTIAAVVIADSVAHEVDAIRITVGYGFDVLLASRYWSKSFVRTPSEWGTRLNESSGSTPVAPAWNRHNPLASGRKLAVSKQVRP